MTYFNYIDEVISGLIEKVGNNNIYDVISELNIQLNYVEPNHIILQGNKAVYLRCGEIENIYISNEDNINIEFIIAHEVGHALLHTDEMEMFYNPVLNKGKLEKEADYFATKLLYSNLEIEDGIETIEQLANTIGVNEEIVKYII